MIRQACRTAAIVAAHARIAGRNRRRSECQNNHERPAIVMFLVFVARRSASPTGPLSAPRPRANTTRRAAASPAPRTGWRSPATTCRRRRCSDHWPRVRQGLRRLHLLHRLLRGWPIIMFLMAERLRNLGRFTFADIRPTVWTSGRSAPGGDRLAHRGRLLSDRADGGRRAVDQAAVRHLLLDGGGAGGRDDGDLRHFRRHGRDHLGADHQGGPAARGRNHRGDLAMSQFGFNFETLAAKAVSVHKDGGKILVPGNLSPTRSRRCRWARAGVRHRGLAAHPDALLHRAGRKAGAQERVRGDGCVGFFLLS